MTSQAAFFLIADDRAIAAPWRDRILTMFSLIQQHAERYQGDDSPARYAEAAEKAFSNLPGLASSQRRIATSNHDTVASAIQDLLRSAPESQTDKQLAFLRRQGLLDDVSSPDDTAGQSCTISPTRKRPTARSWTLYVGAVPRMTRDTQATPSIWIAFANWDTLAAPDPDPDSHSKGQDDRDRRTTEAHAYDKAISSENSIYRTQGRVAQERIRRASGRLHTRVLDATLHDTFFDRYAERWSKFAVNAPSEHIRNDPRFLFIPLKNPASL
ncbi:hypothetical protein [Robbsia sp. KACC 23696]|uniref:hypothetical protein n=1 Tax=Robbsia sp. KACC 23696 TaxID=3149231 RepID=UPI00325B69E2